MIIVRVSSSHDADRQNITSSQRSRSWVSRGLPRGVRHHTSSNFQMRDITVEITEVVYRETDDAAPDLKSPPGIAPDAPDADFESGTPSPRPIVSGAASTPAETHGEPRSAESTGAV